MVASTVPAAVTVLKGYLDAVATQNASTLNPQTSIGIPTASNRPNMLMVGDYETGVLVNPTTYRWAAVPGRTRMRSEEYSILGAIECAGGAGGSSAAAARLADAYQLLGDLMDQITADPAGLGGATDGSTPLSPSGSWGDLTVSMIGNGPKSQSGWGVVLAFELAVINAQLIS